ncbi:hypothetical protein J6590_106425 [Homalodisca vitripennis]|nr:hypothetical protein J6590_106425 [Homalodisca vitripennis]
MSGRRDDSIINTFDSERKRSRKKVGEWDENNTRCLTRRGGGDGSAVARRGADEACADCLHTYSNNAWWRWRDSDDMRGDSRGAVLTTRTHTLSRSLTIFCPRFGLTRFVPDPVSGALSQQRPKYTTGGKYDGLCSVNYDLT